MNILAYFSFSPFADALSPMIVFGALGVLLVALAAFVLLIVVLVRRFLRRKRK